MQNEYMEDVTAIWSLIQGNHLELGWIDGCRDKLAAELDSHRPFAYIVLFDKFTPDAFPDARRYEERLSDKQILVDFQLLLEPNGLAGANNPDLIQKLLLVILQRQDSHYGIGTVKRGKPRLAYLDKNV